MSAKVILLDPVKRKVTKDICPKCSGHLDTGWECNECGFDAHELATGKPFSLHKSVGGE